MRWILLILVALLSLTCLSAESSPDSSASTPWHATWMLEALGLGAALFLAAVLWVLRKILAGFIHFVVLLLAAGLILVALFGRGFGVYDVVLGTRYAAPDAPLLRLRGAHQNRGEEQLGTAGDGEEAYDPDAPSFEEFWRRNAEE